MMRYYIELEGDLSTYAMLMHLLTKCGVKDYKVEVEHCRSGLRLRLWLEDPSNLFKISAYMLYGELPEKLRAEPSVKTKGSRLLSRSKS